MFSTSTMASSTSSPTATAMPPRVMVFTVTPNARKISSVAMIDSGMAVRVMTLVRTLARNRNSTRNTQMVPSRMASMTLSTAVRMKSACRKMCRSMTTPGGNSL